MDAPPQEEQSSGMFSKLKLKANFASFLRDALLSVGINYLSPEHIRISKTSLSEKGDDHSLLVREPIKIGQRE
jgi:hypothetical protein